MRLVIAEKPSVGVAIAAALGISGKKDGYIEGSGYLISWCVGHFVELTQAAAYGGSIRNGGWTPYRFCRRNGSMSFPQIRESNLRP